MQVLPRPHFDSLRSLSASIIKASEAKCPELVEGHAIFADVAQAVEHILGKNEVRSANLRIGSEIFINR